MKTPSLILVCALTIFTGCASLFSSNEKISKYDYRSPYYETKYTAIGLDDHPAMIDQRYKHRERIASEQYYQKNHGYMLVYNTFTHEYEFWNPEAVQRETQNGRIVPTKLPYRNDNTKFYNDLDYTPAGADAKRMSSDQDRIRFQNKSDPRWWREKYGRVPKGMKNEYGVIEE